MMPAWIAQHDNMDLGYLPFFIDDGDPADAVEQLNRNYAHGGGWHDFAGFTLVKNGEPTEAYPWHGSYALQYPEDPLMKELARTHLHGQECIVLFQYSWVAVIQRDETYRVARMD